MQESRKKYIGQAVAVTIREVSRANRKITLNMVEASQILAYRNLKVGAPAQNSAVFHRAISMLLRDLFLQTFASPGACMSHETMSHVLPMANLVEGSVLHLDPHAEALSSTSSSWNAP